MLNCFKYLIIIASVTVCAGFKESVEKSDHETKNINFYNLDIIGFKVGVSSDG